MRPFVITPKLPAGIGCRLSRIALQPAVHVIVIALLAPNEAGECLALHEPRVLADSFWRSLLVEFIRFFFSLVEPRLKRRSEIFLGRRERIARVAIHQPQTDRPAFSRRNFRYEMPRGFRAFHFRIHRAALAVDQVAMKGILHEWTPVPCLI